MKCSICERQHPTILHDDNYKPGAYSSSSTPRQVSSPSTNQNLQQRVINDVSRHLQQQTTTQGPATDRSAHASTSHTMNASQMFLSQHVSSMIVPVYLSHPKENKNRLVYALLDSQSDTSFILDQTLDSFSIPSENTVLNLSTMHGSQSVSTRKVFGFRVQGFNCNNSITLPPLFSRPQIPSNYAHIPTAAFCNKFEHLKSVSSQLMPLQNVEIGLLLGYDVSFVHQPQQVVASQKDSDPYAIRTPLGWCVIGSTGRISNLASCNRISCSERTSIVFKTESTELSPKEIAWHLGTRFLRHTGTSSVLKRRQTVY